jgi:hypothetical protein
MKMGKFFHWFLLKEVDVFFFFFFFFFGQMDGGGMVSGYLGVLPEGGEGF